MTRQDLQGRERDQSFWFGPGCIYKSKEKVAIQGVVETAEGEKL